MSQIIPIQQSKTACVNKWAWSSIYLNTGTTASCHRCRHYAFDENTIMNFHNLPGKLADRNKMLKGEWPGNGCEYCRDVEMVGGISDRREFGNMTDEFIPEKLKTDPTSTVVSPTILEVYFNNTCNQSCVYCRPRFSSQIEYEIRKFGPSKFNNDYGHFDQDDRSNYSTYLSKFFEWMKLHGNKLKHFKMLGGEPLYQDEFNMLLDFFQNNPCPDLRWDIFTNLNHDTEKFKIKIKKLQSLIEQKKIKSVHFVCSIDCWGPDVEYVRYGFNMEIAEKNMNLILETEGATSEIHATITALSLPSMHLLAQKWASWASKKYMTFHWNTVTAPTCFDIYCFGNYLIDDLDRFINQLASDAKLSTEEYFNRFAYQKTILGIKTRMLNSTPDVKQIKNLQGFLDELDTRRNENWKERFPYLANIIKEIISKHDV
jgi:hypothetical protein